MKKIINTFFPLVLCGFVVSFFVILSKKFSPFFTAEVKLLVVLLIISACIWFIPLITNYLREKKYFKLRNVQIETGDTYFGVVLLWILVLFDLYSTSIFFFQAPATPFDLFIHLHHPILNASLNILSIIITLLVIYSLLTKNKQRYFFLWLYVVSNALFSFTFTIWDMMHKNIYIEYSTQLNVPSVGFNAYIIFSIIINLIYTVGASLIIYFHRKYFLGREQVSNSEAGIKTDRGKMILTLKTFWVLVMVLLLISNIVFLKNYTKYSTNAVSDVLSNNPNSQLNATQLTIARGMYEIAYSSPELTTCLQESAANGFLTYSSFTDKEVINKNINAANCISTESLNFISNLQPRIQDYAKTMQTKYPEEKNFINGMISGIDATLNDPKLKLLLTDTMNAMSEYYKTASQLYTFLGENFDKYSVDKTSDGGYTVTFKKDYTDMQQQEEQIVSDVLTLQQDFANKSKTLQNYQQEVLKGEGVDVPLKDFQKLQN